MSYIDKNLIPKERVIFRTGLHWIVLVMPAILGVCFLALGFFLLVDSLGRPDFQATTAGALVSLAGGLIILVAVINRRATEMAVTNKRVIIKVGFVRRRTIELFLTKVESVDVVQGIFARMLGYGTVVVRGTGGSREPFDKIQAPLDFRREVQRLSEPGQWD